LPIASTLIRAVVVGVLGIVTLWLPSLAVLAKRTVGKVFPPSVDREILTFGLLNGALAVLPAFHVTVWAELPAHETEVFGAVTLKAPPVAFTVTTISSNCVCPTVDAGTYGLLSLTVSLKFKVLATELNASIFVPASPPGSTGVTNKPACTVDSRGMYLVGDVDEANDSQFGPVVFVGDAMLFAPEVVELSFCSQL